VESEKVGDDYQANDATPLVGEIFSGGLSVGDAIERLRTRLLDLSARNGLINYRHPKARCVQIADEPNINLVFERLYVDGKGVPFKYVPEPPLDTYEGKRPEARVHAAREGISCSFEFQPNPAGANGRRLHGIQTLLYPADLERQLRKIAGEAKTAIEETGSNMLFLVFGFLEFYDSEDSERPMLAPLLSLPVELIRGDIDRETRTYQYTIQHNGEDLAENHTLRERLRRDFMLSLPEFNEEDEPEPYFVNVEQAIKTKRRWKVRRQITLGMLSFGKLAIWADLDTKKNPALTDHELIKSVFSGGKDGGGGGLHAEDYRIDERPEASQPLIYNADSSQHSAIIDVLAGKNLVINGPPGTGKSQTITNIIATAMSQGKKVLFVSEKLAALEVVRHRLNQAGLGHFCLELHSHKTQKKKFLEDLQTRIEEHFPAPAQFQAKLATLKRQKTELARYAELMGSKVRNALGMTVNEVFWAAERRRQELGDLCTLVHTIRFPNASNWTHDDVEARRSRLAGLAELYGVVGRFDFDHPWWGFRPNPLAPSDDETIARTIDQALVYARAADAAAERAVAFFGFREQPDSGAITDVRCVLESVTPIPNGVDSALLARMFDPEFDPVGRRSAEIITQVVSSVTKARGLFESACGVLGDGHRLSPEEANKAAELAVTRKLSSDLMSAELGVAQDTVARFEKALTAFERLILVSRTPYGRADKADLNALLTNAGKSPGSRLGQFPIRSIASRAAAVLETVRTLSEVVEQVGSIAARRGLAFDTNPASVARLADPDILPGLTKGAGTDIGSLSEARRLAEFPLGDKPTDEISRLGSLLKAEISACSDALARCRQTADRLNIGFDSSEAAVGEIAAMAAVAAGAPGDLLEYRSQNFGRTRTVELIGKIRTALTADKNCRATFGALVYLDALPPPQEMKAAAATLRRQEGFFALFNGTWRKARKSHMRLCKEKRKLSPRQRAEELASLATWVDANESFVSDSELKQFFGGLFQGLDTDPVRIGRLNHWYVSGRATLLNCPGLVEKVDLTSIPADRISEVAVKADSVKTDIARLTGAEAAVQDILGAGVAGFHDAKARGWGAGLESLGQAAQTLSVVADFFSSRADANLSPKDILRLMEARAELDGVASELALLIRGKTALREAGGEELSWLADLADGSWADAIPQISAQASLAAATASQALFFAADNCPLSVAEAFANAKLNLDSAWSDVSPVPAWDSVDCWKALADIARDDLASASAVIEYIAPLAGRGVSASHVFAAYQQESDARSTLEHLAALDGVGRTLGPVFDEAATDLERLSTTHSWGASVCALNLPATVRQRLLSGDAREALVEAMRLYSDMDNECHQAKETLESLASYGSFTWDDWQKQARANPSGDTPSEIKGRLETVAGNVASVLPWSKYLSLREQALREGLTDFVIALESGKMPAAALASAFEFAAYQSIGRAIYKAFPELSQFNGNAHDKTRNDYQLLDAEIVSLTGKDFASQIERRTSVPEGQRGTTVGDFTEMHLLRREINKQRRHIPIRQLVKRAGNALQALKPCFMMGPLSVAQYLEQGALKFDLVVMDEASQLRPEEALGAVARGAQLVVVGDPKQLPPTSFFDRMVDSADDEEEDEAPAAISGMESILDICQQLFTPVRSLRWHYRSHHESLIAFSNHHFYKNLIVFPSPYAKNPGLGVKYRYVKGGAYSDRRNLPEAQRLVDAVLEHMIKHPEESLGVVTLNQTQRELIEELLDKKLKTFIEGANFTDRWAAEGWPFFVKNLENVQGDERDVIFISTTFGKASGTDKVRQNFGPISRPDGWRRLNVLFTRAKRRIELFTSMSPEDIIVDQRTPLGTKALRDYLDFAKRGVLVTTDETDREPDSDFEVSVANVVTSLGYEVKPQLGVAGFFIDMVVRNPDRPGEYLAAIECDGATYHSGFSVRDRDRIRQEILESLGWQGRIHRIWSTDWFYNPRRETDRLRSFLEERRRISAAADPTDWDGDEFEETCADAETETATADLAEATSTTSSATEDLFVEVGDRVVYCPVLDPNEKHSVLIVDSESNAKLGIINEHTPLAQALLGLSPGDVGDLVISGQTARQLRLLKIQGRGELLL
jgi:transcription elongation GreA/GreB family factor